MGNGEWMAMSAMTLFARNREALPLPSHMKMHTRSLVSYGLSLRIEKPPPSTEQNHFYAQAFPSIHWAGPTLD